MLRSYSADTGTGTYCISPLLVNRWKKLELAVERTFLIQQTFKHVLRYKIFILYLIGTVNQKLFLFLNQLGLPEPPNLEWLGAGAVHCLATVAFHNVSLSLIFCTCAGAWARVFWTVTGRAMSGSGRRHSLSMQTTHDASPSPGPAPSPQTRGSY